MFFKELYNTIGHVLIYWVYLRCLTFACCSVVLHHMAYVYVWFVSIVPMLYTI